MYEPPLKRAAVEDFGAALFVAIQRQNPEHPTKQQFAEFMEGLRTRRPEMYDGLMDDLEALLNNLSQHVDCPQTVVH